MQDDRKVITDFILKEFKPAFPLDDRTPLVQQGIIDSLAILTLIGFIKEQFGVDIDPDDVAFENFETVADIHELVVSRRSRTQRFTGGG